MAVRSNRYNTKELNMLCRNGSFVRAWLEAAAVAIAAGLVACGGGGGATDTTPTPVVLILDSFGRTVPPGDSGVGAGDSGTDGTAGDGAAVAGGTVVITDAAGKSVSAITDVQGYFRAKVTGFVPPFIARVTKTDGKVLHSLNVKATKVNGFIALNITGLTDKVASDVARAGGKSGAADLTPQIVAANAGVIATSVNNLKNQIAPVIAAAAIDPATFDPLSVPFRPDHTGYDFVLDNTVVTVGPDGQTQVAVSPTFKSPGSLQGTWAETIVLSLDGQTAVPPQTIPAFDVAGSNVPQDSQAAAAGVCATSTSFVQAVAGATITVACSGNTITAVTAATANTPQVTTTFAFTPVSYVGCGSCGIGTQVVVTFKLTETSTANGSVPVTFTLVETYVRKS